MAFLEFLVMNLRLCRGVNGNRNKRTNKDVFIPTRSARPSYEKINTLTVGVGVCSSLDNKREKEQREIYSLSAKH